MNLPSLALFTSPERAWHAVTRKEQHNAWQYLPHLLVFALIPAISMYLGTHWVGWTLAEGETVRLEHGSAFQLALLLYITSLLGTFVMGLCIRLISYSFERKPSLNQCIAFTAYLLTPLFVAGLAALYPNRPLALLALGAGSLYATFLLYVGFPIFMHTRQSKGFFFASAIWGIGLLLLVTLLVSMILYWNMSLPTEYLRQGIPNVR